jgi:hypothetical protein
MDKILFYQSSSWKFGRKGGTMKKTCRILGASIGLIFGFTPGYTQPLTQIVSGVVVDEFRNSQKNCIVSFSGAYFAKDTSDSQGNFSISSPTIGIHGFAQINSEKNQLDSKNDIRYDFNGRRYSSFPISNFLPTVAPSLLSLPIGSSLGKVSAMAGTDSLLISCPDFVPNRIAITELGATVEIKMNRNWDIVVYGGTSGAVMAAVQAVHMGKHVVLVSPDKRLGGLSSGGLGETDIGNKAAIGGISRDFYQRIAQKYLTDSAWVQESKASYARYSAMEMWTFEPKVALAVFKDLITENKIPVFYGERIDLSKTLKMSGKQIVSFTVESGLIYFGKMFIDATYEGDLMAKAGVSYTVGREPNSQYSETINGIQTSHATAHQLHLGISPYVKALDSTSGLLPGIFRDVGGEDGSGDKKVQAYNYRMTLTNIPENRIAFTKPKDYDEKLYELLFRHIEAGFLGTDFFNFSPMPNRKTDSNNSGGFSTDFIGMNYAYPDGSYAVRNQIIKQHESYQRGLLWTLANHSRIPQAIRDKYSLWGLAKDEYPETGNWSPQLYIREARRMIGSMVMTQKEVLQTAKVLKPIGMAAYTMDSHHTQRYVDVNGQVRNEGDVQQKGFGPYPVDYGALVPKQTECVNLLVPFCLSASHIAFGSIRMEPVFMLLSQTAATAASQAIDAGVDIQAVDYAKLRARLLADKQVLEIVQ